jgi:NPCBM/NEW2 domain
VVLACDVLRRAWRGVSARVSARAVSVALGLAVLVAPVAMGGTAEPEPTFTAFLLDGRMETGRLVSLGPGVITLASAEGAKHELALEWVFKLTREPADTVVPLDRSMVILPEGDRLRRLTLGTATETALEAQSDALGKLSIPLDALVGWIMVEPRLGDEVDAIWDRVRLEPRKDEVVWLSNGDRLTGGFLGYDRVLKLLCDGKPREVESSRIVAVGFDPSLVHYPRPKSGFLEFSLHDGTRFGATDARIDDGSVEATARFGGKVRFPLGELVAVHVRNPSYVYLTERKPVRASYFPYVGPTREYRMDRMVDGHLFELGGQTFDRGIGTQSRTLLAYRIEAGDRRFQARVGVDERAGPAGSVVFRVLVDKEKRFQSQPLTHRDAPVAIDVDLAGGKFLILDTDFGERGNIRDFADWVEARLVR